MPFNDGIPKVNCYSLTDFHNFEYCPFKFYITHHLDRKYELDEGSEQMALGTLLDESIKLFHKTNAYGQPPEYLPNLIAAAKRVIKEKVASQNGKLTFYSAMLPFLTDELAEKANKIFKDYYLGRDKKINRSIGPVGFCEWVIKGEDSQYKLWGGPDAYEIGDDGMIEVVDYKSREDIERGKGGMDMDLMPKIYMLLTTNFLVSRGYDKARFRVRFWQDPKDESFYEEFELSVMNGAEFLFKQRIDRILNNKELKFCEKHFCKACQSKKREEYLIELQKLGLILG